MCPAPVNSRTVLACEPFHEILGCGLTQIIISSSGSGSGSGGGSGSGSSSSSSSSSIIIIVFSYRQTPQGSES